MAVADATTVLTTLASWAEIVAAAGVACAVVLAYAGFLSSRRSVRSHSQGTLTGGSFFRRARAVATEAATSQELRERFIQLEHVIALNSLDSKQAAVNVGEAEAARKLIESIADVPQACLRLGSLLVVKYQDAGGPVLLTKNLSQPEMHALDRSPEILENPRQALDALADAVPQDDGQG